MRIISGFSEFVIDGTVFDDFIELEKSISRALSSTAPADQRKG